MSDRIQAPDKATTIKIINELMEGGLSFEEAMAFVNTAQFRVAPDAELSEDPARRLMWWDHDIDEDYEGGHPDVANVEFDPEHAELSGTDSEPLGNGASRKLPVRYD